MEIELDKFDDFTVIGKTNFNIENLNYDGEFIPAVNKELKSFYYYYRPYNCNMLNLNGKSYLAKASAYSENANYCNIFPYPNPSANFNEVFKARIKYTFDGGVRPNLGSVEARDTVIPFYAKLGMEVPADCYQYPTITSAPSNKYCFKTSVPDFIPPINGAIFFKYGDFHVTSIDLIDPSAEVIHDKYFNGTTVIQASPSFILEEPPDYVYSTMSYNSESMRWEGYFDVTFVVKGINRITGEENIGGLGLRIKYYQTYAYRIPNITYSLDAIESDLTVSNLTLYTGATSIGAPNENKNFMMVVNGDTIETGALIYAPFFDGTVDNVRPNWCVYNQWDLTGKKLIEMHTVFNDGYEKFEVDRSQETIDLFIDYFKNRLELNCFSYGATISDKIRISGAQIDKAFPIYNDNDYFIDVNGEANDLFSITDGAYCALINPYSKKVYFILLGSIKYYELDLTNFYADRIDFFGFSIMEKCIYLGTKDPDTAINKYAKLVINIKFNFPKLVFNANKLNFSFIPCQTHCLGKGGITSKV